MNFKLSICTASVLCCFSSLAQDNGIERIIVSSDFRSQEIQNLTASVSVIDQVQVQQRQAQHLEEILNLAANVNFASGASRGRFVQIRGIGERSQFSEPINPSVGFMVDDMDFSGIAGLATLFDVEQVEILRGPQATEFGASAMAGAIKIKTTEATKEQVGKLELSAAQNNSYSVGLAYGAALADNLFYRVALQKYSSDGFIHNSYLDTEDSDNLDELTSRIKLKYLPSDDLSIDLNYQYFDIDNGYDAFSLDNDGVTRSDEPGFDRQKTRALGLKSEYTASWGNLLLLVNGSDSDLAYGYDEDWTYIGFHPFEYSSTDYYFRQRDTKSADIRLLSNDSSKLFSDSTDWVVGLFNKSNNEELLRQYTYADADFMSNYSQGNIAAYSQLNSKLSPNLNLLTGLRVDRFNISYSDSAVYSDDLQETVLGGKLVLDYASEQANVYASISRGYKAGGFNPDERLVESSRSFGHEYNWNYELGVKGRLINHDAFVRLAIFYMDRKDTQVSDFATFLRDDNTTGFVDIIGNAATGTNLGLELESGWQVSDAWKLALNLGLLKAEIKEYRRADGSIVPKQDQAQAPAYTFHVASTYALADNLSWHLAAEGKDEFRFSDGHDELSPSFVLVNSRVTYSIDEVDLSLWAKNVFDRRYYVRGFGGFSNDPRDFYETPEPYFQLGDGRQFGLSLNYQF